MLRRNKKKDQTTAVAPSNGRGPHSEADQHPSAASPPANSHAYDAQHHHHHHRTPANASGRMPSSSSADLGPGSVPVPSYPYAQPAPSGLSSSASSATLAQPQSIGRSGGALGFIFSKAKNTFAGSSSQGSSTGAGEPSYMPSGSLGSSTGIPPSSASIASLASFQDDNDLYRPDFRGAGFQGATMSSPSKMAQRITGDEGPSYGYRAGQGTARSNASEYIPTAVSSPTSKSFFSRDRKTSAASGSSRAVAGAGQAVNGGSYGRSGTGGGGGGGGSGALYGPFSRSQADLNLRRDYPSPASVNSELPRIPMVSSSRAGSSNTIVNNGYAYVPDERAFLRSPSPHSLFSHSVDDLTNNIGLASPSSKAIGLRSPSPQLLNGSSALPLVPGSFEDQGNTLQQPTWTSAADLAGRSLQPSSTHSSSRAVSPSGSKGDMASSSGYGNVTGPQGHQISYPYAGRTISPSPDSKGGHHRTGSKALAADSFFGAASSSSRDSSRRTGTGGSGTSGGMSASFSLTNVAAGASNVLDRLRGPGTERLAATHNDSADSQRSVSLPPGVTYQGLLCRNSNLSVPLSQLGSVGHREKDVSKGWKPYKVFLKDGQMVFFKPPNSLNDEARDLFPSTIVRPPPGVGGAQDALSKAYGLQPFDANMLKQSGLGTQDLLNATKVRAGSDTSPLPRSPPTSPIKRSPLATLPDHLEEEEVVEVAQLNLPTWHRDGKHQDLTLAGTLQRPTSWPERIEGGTPEALIHEVVHATQMTSDDDPRDAISMLQSTLYVILSSGWELSRFLSEVRKEVTEALKPLLSDQLHGQRVDHDLETEAFKAGVKGRIQSLLEILVSHHADQLTSEDVAGNICGLTFNITDALAVQSSSRGAEGDDSEASCTATDWDKATTGAARPKLASLAEGHFSASDLLTFEPADVAAQIQIFHCDRLKALAVPRLWISKVVMGAKDASGAILSNTAPLLFGFSAAEPHYLTRLALEQILDRKSVSKQGFSASAAKHRASLLRHWIAIASYLLSFGDILGWVAIMAALCSRAVARLEHTWRYVAEGDRILHASSWTPKLAKLDWDEEGKTPFAGVVTLNAITSRQPKNKDGKKQQPVPFFGDVLHRIRMALSNTNSSNQLPIANVCPDVNRLYGAVNSWFTDTCRSQPLPSSEVPGVGAPIKEFQQSLQTLAAATLSSSTPQSISSFLQISFLLEPRGLGNLDLRWRQPLPPQTAAKAIIPLLFSEALPNLDLLDRDEVLAVASSGLPQQRLPGGGTTASSESTIRAGKYVRSPLGGTPLMGPPNRTSLRRSRTYPSAGRTTKVLPFGDISEWASLSDRGSVPGDDGTVFKIGSDLILKAVEVPQFHSSSGSPMLSSKRFSQELSKSGTRPLSQLSKRSSLPASQRSSMVDVFVSSQVMVKAASLERLVDVLVLGVSDLTVTLSDDNGEVPLQAAKRSKLSIDLHAFRITFLATFRSICSPIVLFDFLRKRFLAAINASIEIGSMPQHANTSRFPSWSMVPASSLEVSTDADPVDWDYVARVRGGVISVLMLWVQRYTQDFLDFTDLTAAFNTFIQHQEEELKACEINGVSSGKRNDSEFGKIVSTLHELESMLRMNMLRVNTRSNIKIDGPPLREERDVEKEGKMDGSTAIEQGDFDGASALQIVEHLECVASVFFDKISEKDLLAVAELFERQAIDPLGWHAVREQGPSDQQILTMYKLLEFLPAPEGEDEAARVFQRLPASVRDACSAHSLLRGWVAVHIIEGKIGLQCRQARIEKLLDAIWICRARMLNARSDDASSTPLAANVPFQDATVGSFVESVIVGSLTAPESRTFVRAWQGVCHSRGGSGEGLDDLLPPRGSLATLNAASASSPSTPDVGWLLRSIAQAVSRKSPLALTDSTLVDFERSQIVFNLIESSFVIRPTPADQATAELASSRLGAMQAKLRRVHWDRRAFREEAAREAADAPVLPTSTTYRAAKPLQKVTAGHTEKQHRDRAAYESLKWLSSSHAAGGGSAASNVGPSSGGIATGQSRSPAFGPQEVIGRPSFTLASANSGPSFSAEKRSRRVTALFRGAVRGTTGLITSSSNSEKADRTGAMDAPHRSANSLLNSISTSQKPAFVINLAGARIAVWNNLQRSHVFHLSTLDGEYFLLQATALEDLNEWIAHVSRVIRETPVSRGVPPFESRRGGPASLLNKGKGSIPMTISPSNTTPLYGVELATLVEKEGRPVPAGLERMLSIVEARGLKEQGIYRISGAKNSIEALKYAFSTQSPDSVNLDYGEFSDVHTIAGAIKQWYRELPEPVIPYAFYHRIIAAEGIETHDERLYAIRDAIWEFPRCHFDLLQRTAEHLGRVAEEAEHNKMLAHNLGLVFGTSLLNPPPSATSIAESFGSLGKAANVVKLIVTFHDWLFEPEAEAEDETAGPEGGEEQKISKEADSNQIPTSASGDDPDETLKATQESSLADGSGDGEGSSVRYTMIGDSSSLPRSDDLVQEGDTNVLPSSDASVNTEQQLLAQLQAEVEADTHEGPAPAPSSSGSGLLVPSSSGESQSAPKKTAALRSLSTSPGSSEADIEGLTDSESEIAQRRPQGSSSLSRRSLREESVYADALEVALDSTSVTRGSLLPDEAMLDILRMIGSTELGGAEGDVVVDPAEMVSSRLRG